MRCLIILLALCWLYLLGPSTGLPMDPHRRLKKQPFPQSIFKAGLEPGEKAPGVNGGIHLEDERLPKFEGYPRKPTGPYDIRKGEYECGDMICILQPGEIPKGCNGMCQYMVGPQLPHSGIDFDDTN